MWSVGKYELGWFGLSCWKFKILVKIVVDGGVLYV